MDATLDFKTLTAVALGGATLYGVYSNQASVAERKRTHQACCQKWGWDDASSINRPREIEGSSFKSTQGFNLHVSKYLPKDPKDIKCSLVYLHGYGGHANHSVRAQCFSSLAQDGVAVFAYDHVGHGYSEGERCYIPDINPLLDDVLAFLGILYGDDEGRDNGNIFPTPEYKAALGKLPFFVGGESMGGGISIATGLRMQEMGQQKEGPTYLKYWKGLILCAGLIAASNKPPAPVLTCLRYLVAPMIPMWTVPKAIEPVLDAAAIYADQKWQDALQVDVHGMPNGIAWGHNMRFGTGIGLLDFTDYLEANANKLACPFLALHDPEDRIVKFEPIEKMAENSKDGVLVKIRGGRHDIIVNKPDVVHCEISSWIMTRLA